MSLSQSYHHRNRYGEIRDIDEINNKDDGIEAGNSCYVKCRQQSHSAVELVDSNGLEPYSSARSSINIGRDRNIGGLPSFSSSSSEIESAESTPNQSLQVKSQHYPLDYPLKVNGHKKTKKGVNKKQLLESSSSLTVGNYMGNNNLLDCSALSIHSVCKSISEQGGVLNSYNKENAINVHNACQGNSHDTFKTLNGGPRKTNQSNYNGQGSNEQSVHVSEVIATNNNQSNNHTNQLNNTNTNSTQTKQSENNQLQSKQLIAQTSKKTSKSKRFSLLDNIHQLAIWNSNQQQNTNCQQQLTNNDNQLKSGQLRTNETVNNLKPIHQNAYNNNNNSLPKTNQQSKHYQSISSALSNGDRRRWTSQGCGKNNRSSDSQSNQSDKGVRYTTGYHSNDGDRAKDIEVIQNNKAISNNGLKHQNGNIPLLTTTSNNSLASNTTHPIPGTLTFYNVVINLQQQLPLDYEADERQEVIRLQMRKKVGWGEGSNQVNLKNSHQWGWVGSQQTQITNNSIPANANKSPPTINLPAPLTPSLQSNSTYHSVTNPPTPNTNQTTPIQLINTNNTNNNSLYHHLNGLEQSVNANIVNCNNNINNCIHNCDNNCNNNNSNTNNTNNNHLPILHSQISKPASPIPRSSIKMSGQFSQKNIVVNNGNNHNHNSTPYHSNKPPTPIPSPNPISIRYNSNGNTNANSNNHISHNSHINNNNNQSSSKSPKSHSSPVANSNHLRRILSNGTISHHINTNTNNNTNSNTNSNNNNNNNSNNNNEPTLTNPSHTNTTTMTKPASPIPTAIQLPNHMNNTHHYVFNSKAYPNQSAKKYGISNNNSNISSNVNNANTNNNKHPQTQYAPPSPQPNLSPIPKPNSITINNHNHILKQSPYTANNNNNNVISNSNGINSNNNNNNNNIINFQYNQYDLFSKAFQKKTTNNINNNTNALQTTSNNKIRHSPHPIANKISHTTTNTNNTTTSHAQKHKIGLR